MKIPRKKFSSPPVYRKIVLQPRGTPGKFQRTKFLHPTKMGSRYWPASFNLCLILFHYILRSTKISLPPHRTRSARIRFNVESFAIHCTSFNGLFFKLPCLRLRSSSIERNDLPKRSQSLEQVRTLRNRWAREWSEQATPLELLGEGAHRLPTWAEFRAEEWLVREELR